MAATTELILMIRPHCALSIGRTASLVNFITAIKLTCMTSSHWCSFILGKQNELYFNLFLFQVGVFVILPVDLLLRKMELNIKVFRFITHFISMNTALLIGFFKFLLEQP